MKKQKIRIVKKNDYDSLEYEIGDVFEVESTWYGGVNVVSKSGIPLSLDRMEYEEYEEAGRSIDVWSYELGVMDCFCEMVASGLKKLAMSHPCRTREERDSYQEEVKRLCEKYAISFFSEDEPFLTPLFPEDLNKGTYHYLFFRTQDVLDEYRTLKEEQKALKESGAYTPCKGMEIARRFGSLLSYPPEGIERLLQKAAAKNSV